MQSSPMKVDPIKFEVIRNGLLEATEEMAAALRRSAYSTNIKTRCDFSCCFFDRDIRPIAQSFSQPNHLGSMVGTVRQAVLEYGVENLGPGDHLVTNYPYPGGAHLNDIVVIEPFHDKGEVYGYLANLAHHVDVGGGAPASVGGLPGDLPRRRDHPAGEVGASGKDRRRRLPADAMPRCGPSARRRATSGLSSRPTTPACGG